jgi:hypothetical protein
MIALLEARRILLGVTGSIAAYKAAELASQLTQAGAQVDAVLTEAAQRFVSALTFQSLTGRQAYTEADLWGTEAHVLHVGLAQGADLLVIAPATADTLAKLAQGRADTLLTLTALAATCPLLLAPAMDAGMYGHPATQANLEILRSRGAILVGPVEGRMASGLVGPGRMVEPAELMGHIRLALGRNGPLTGRKVVVTAGGTQEPLDPVRALTNHSSGKQGCARPGGARPRCTGHADQRAHRVGRAGRRRGYPGQDRSPDGRSAAPSRGPGGRAADVGGGGRFSTGAPLRAEAQAQEWARTGAHGRPAGPGHGTAGA